VRIGELVKRTQVSKQTIHHYINAGVLPKPRKLGRNSADYSDWYVDQIRTIKALQKNQLLPLSEIGKILKKQQGAASPDPSLLQLQSQYLKPVERLSPNSIVGRRAFRDATGLSGAWLDKFQEWGIITPAKKNTRWVYSHDDVIIGKLIQEMSQVGADGSDSFDPERLKQVSELFRESMVKARRQLFESISGMVPKEDMLPKVRKINELMGIYYYHLCRKHGEESD